MLRFEKPAPRDCHCTPITDESLHFRRTAASFAPFCWRFHASFLVPEVGEPSHRPANKRTSSTSFQIVLPISVEGGTATPYVHPVRPKVTQCHPRLRASAEGRNPKMRKPGMSWVNDWWHNRHRLACRLLTANCLIFQRPSNPGSWVASAPSQLALARLSILPALNQSFHRDRTLPGKGLSINDHP